MYGDIQSIFGSSGRAYESRPFQDLAHERQREMNDGLDRLAQSQGHSAYVTWKQAAVQTNVAMTWPFKLHCVLMT